MGVKCPYGEKKGFAVYCRLAGKKVSPLKYPCTSEHYEKCPIYVKYAKEVREVREEAPRVAEESAPIGERAGREVQRSAQGGFKKPEEARTCHECIFYSELTNMCLKLRIKVDDPNNPPCKRR